MTRSAEAIAERPIPKVLEENNGKRVGAKWRNPYPLGRVKKDAVSKTSEVNAPLLEMIAQFEPPLNGLVPLWQDSLTPGLEQLNTARVIYQSAQVSLGVEHRTDYPFAIQQDLEAIRDDFRDIRGSNRAGIGEGEAFKRWVTHEKLEEARMQLHPAIEPYERILAHTKQWVKFILATYKVEFTPGIEAFVNNAAKAAVIILQSGKEQACVENVKEGLLLQLNKPDSPKISFVDLKPGTLQELIYSYLIIGCSAYKISQYFGLKNSEVHNIRKSLRRSGKLLKLEGEEYVLLQKKWGKERFLDAEFKNRTQQIVDKRVKTAQERGFYHSPETRKAMSTAKEGKLAEIAELTPYLSTQVIAQLFGKSSHAVRCSLSRMRKQGDIDPLGDNEKKLRVIRSNYENYIDGMIRTSFTSNMENKRAAYEQAIPFATQVISNLISRIYPIEQVPPEKRDLFIAKVAHKALQSYDQNSNHGFHAHVALLVSRLPKSFIFGKIEL